MRTGMGPDLGSAEWRAAVEEKIGGLGEEADHFS